MARIQLTLYENAPKLLIDTIHDATLKLNETRVSSGETKSWKYWSDVISVTKYALGAIKSLQLGVEECAQLRTENYYLRHRLSKVESELSTYKIIEHLKLTGNFDMIVEAVDTYMAIEKTQAERAENDE